MWQSLPKWARLAVACLICLAILVGIGLLIDRWM